jgi:hypothetical protein
MTNETIQRKIVEMYFIEIGFIGQLQVYTKQMFLLEFDVDESSKSALRQKKLTRK